MPTKCHDFSRRAVLRGIAGSTALVALPFINRRAFAQDNHLAPYLEAKIDWRQAEGQRITVPVIPSGSFEHLIALTPQFEALTGVHLTFEKVPPTQIRQKAILDLTARSGIYATHAADPMYYPLYQANGWVEPLDAYLEDPSLTDKAWFRPDDIVPTWSGANSVHGKLYGVPFDGEVTLQVVRKDLFAAKGLKPADDLDEFVANARELHDPSNRLWGTALRGVPGAGQNVYIYSSIFRSFGGEWLPDGKLTVNGPEAEGALEWYVQTLKNYAPAATQNWNWPDIADAFSQGTLASYIDGNASASVASNPEKSKVIGNVAFARWPKGPAGKRVSSIWNWGFPINAAVPEATRKAAWLFIQWATSTETQIRTSYRFKSNFTRVGVNRLSLWEDPEHIASIAALGDNFVEATLTALREDTDVDWRPRVPQWPAVGETLATAIATALAGQATPKAALDAAQAQIVAVLQ